MPHLQHAVLWRRLREAGAEYGSLWQESDGFQIRGTIVTILAGQPAVCRYGIGCDPAWQTRSLHLALRSRDEQRVVHMTVDEDRRWFVGADEVAPLRGAIDIDLTVTPSTKTIPIRRLALHRGQTRDVHVAVMTFPDLRLFRKTHRYTRIDERRYVREETPEAARTEIEIDDYGLVARFGEIWEQSV